MEFTVSTIIKAPKLDLYNGWLNSKIHSEMTGGSAEVSPEIGKKFTAWDKYISGTNLELSPGFIKQSWRTTDFENDQEDSILEIHFEETKTGSTKITLHHKNLLEKDTSYKKGWIEHYFEPMKSFFEK